MNKMVYLFHSKRLEEEKSVLDKIKFQINSFGKYYNIIFLTFHKNKIQNIDIGEHIYSYEKTKNDLFTKIKYNKILIKNIMNELSLYKPDVIYIRDAQFFLNLYSQLSKIAPVFVEIQTDIISEDKITNYKLYIIEKMLRRRYFKNVTGFICITDEILQIEQRYNSKPGFVMGNGIDKNEIKFISKTNDNGYINLLFIGSPNMAWHGVERLINSFENALNKDKFMLHIVGYENNFNINNKNVIFYGFIKDKNKIGNLFTMSDIGIGTLALYKKNMSEAAPLKVRNYLAKGLPVIIGYEDTDLKGNLPFVMRVKNNDSIIDFNEIEKFYNDTKLIRKNGDTVKFALDNLTWDKKMGQVAGFIESECPK